MCPLMNYLQLFAGLCTENFRWNVWIDAAYLGNFALPYNPDKKEKKKKHVEGLVTLKYTD